MSEQIEEKVVAADGISSVEDPATPAGGAIKKKKADVKSAGDAKADKLDVKTPGNEKAVMEDEEATEEVIEENVISIDESVAAMFEGMDLSEEFKNKATLVFEAAVHAASEEKADAIVEAKTAELTAELQEQAEATVETMVENLDTYLDYVVENWMSENELAIEAGIKVQMAESLMDGLRDLFVEHNIDVEEETVDIVEALEAELEEVKEFANDRINENVEFANEIAAYRAASIFEEMTESMTLTQREKLRVLSEKLDFGDITEYTTNLETLKESFFSEDKPVLTEEVEEEEIMTEETAFKAPASNYSSVNALVEALNARK